MTRYNNGLYWYQFDGEQEQAAAAAFAERLERLERGRTSGNAFLESLEKLRHDIGKEYAVSVTVYHG